MLFVPGLDDVLGGGIPEFSFVLVAGGPGCGKTTLAHQATTFLIGEYDDGERDSAVFTVADGVIRMTQSIEVHGTGHLGLGLYIAHEIVHSHGGTLVVRSGGGTTTFIASLPRVPPQDSAER